MENGPGDALNDGVDEEEGAPSRISGFVKMMDTLKTCSSTDAKKSGCLTVAEATELVEHYNRLYQLDIPTSRVNVSGELFCQLLIKPVSIVDSWLQQKFFFSFRQDIIQDCSNGTHVDAEAVFRILALEEGCKSLGQIPA